MDIKAIAELGFPIALAAFLIFTLVTDFRKSQAKMLELIETLITLVKGNKK